MPVAAVDQIRLATPLYDLGKIAIPDHIFLRPDRLTYVEFAYMKKHVEVGAKILGSSRSPLLQLAELIARCHHERWEGSGYPQGSKVESIPIEARVVAVADVYDALISELPYKKAWSHDKAVGEIRFLSGIWFDPRVVDAFLAIGGKEHQAKKAA